MTTKQFTNIDETLYSDVLDNGLHIHVLKKSDFSKSYAFFATNYGGADRRFRLGDTWIDTPAGVAHFLEHKMFDTPDGGNALNILSANGASPNAYTSSGITAYYFESTQGFYENLETLLNFVSIPHFTEESVSKEQGIIGQEIRMIEDHPGHAVYYNLMKLLYANHPVRDSVAGTIESISHITAQTLYDCHKVFYHPSNMVLCVAGDVDAQKVRDLAEKVLPKTKGVVPERDYGTKEAITPLAKLSEVQMAVSSPQFLAGAKLEVPENGQELLRQNLTLEITLSCLMGRSSPFYAKLYADGLLNDTFSYEVDYTASTATVFFGGESVRPKEVFSEVKEACARAAEQGLDPALFEQRKKAAYGSHLRRLGHFEVQCRNLADGQFAGYCPLEAFDILESITVEDANTLIRTLLIPDHFALSIVNPINA